MSAGETRRIRDNVISISTSTPCFSVSMRDNVAALMPTASPTSLSDIPRDVRAVRSALPIFVSICDPAPSVCDTIVHVFEVLQHTADIRLHVTGHSSEELFADALRGLMRVVEPEGMTSEAVTAEVRLDATDTTVLLVDFLNEALTRAH